MNLYDVYMQYKEKKKGNDIDDKKEEKSQFMFEERNDEMNFNNDINASSKGFGEITGQSGKLTNIKTCTASDGKKRYFMYNIAGKLINQMVIILIISMTRIMEFFFFVLPLLFLHLIIVCFFQTM